MINIIVNSDSKFSINKFAVQSAVMDVLREHKIRGNLEIGITIVGDAKMHEINKTYRGIDTTTNVLSFPYEQPKKLPKLMHINKMGFVPSPDKVVRLGDIVVSYPEAQKDAVAEGIPVEEEIHMLVEHGTKHLLGIHQH
jgi:probable rRNA maturation factor